jgi:hypothetical protein
MQWLSQQHQLKIVRDVTIITQQCKQSQTISVQGCFQLTILNLNHFKIFEDMGLQIIPSMSP